MESMTAVGFSDEELDSVLTILAGILLLGDIVSACQKMANYLNTSIERSLSKFS